MSTVRKVEVPFDAPILADQQSSLIIVTNKPAKPPPAPRGPRGACRQPMPWHPMAYMDDFLDNLRAEEKSDQYVAMVRVGLSYFSQFAAKEGIRHPEEITRSHLLHYQVWLKDECKTAEGNPFAASYRQKLMAYLRTWVGWLVELDHIETTPWVRIKVGHTPKMPKPLSDEEIAALFEAHRRDAYKMSPFGYQRRELILTLLYAWGLRIHELAALNMTEMDARLDFVPVKNKGHREPKAMPYGPVLKGCVLRWAKWRATEVEVGEDALLIGSTGQRLSINRIRDIISDLGHAANVNVNPHRLRDSFGTKMVENDVDILRVMQMMGHTKREQTLPYVRLGNKQVKSEHDRVMGPLLNDLLVSTLPDKNELEPPPGWPGRAEWEKNHR